MRFFALFSATLLNSFAMFRCFGQLFGHIRMHLDPLGSIQRSAKSISKLLKIASEPSGGARVLAACRRSCSLEVDSFALTFRFSEAPQALRANFFASTGRFRARLARSKGPRTRFWKPKRLDFRGFSGIPAARGKITHTGGRHCKNCGFRSTRRV